MKLKKGAALLLACLLLFCTGCFQNGDDDTPPSDSGPYIPYSGVGASDSTILPQNLYGDFVYPDDPIQALHSHLIDDIAKRDLPIRIGEITANTGASANGSVFTAYFTEHDNACAFSFASNSAYGAEDYFSVDGKDNPSFTIAFKDPENTEDMVTIMTAVILYFSPDMAMADAQQLAVGLDESITVDGYSIPKDIGGYQVQAHYTNPHVFFATPDFLSYYGVSVYALKQIWGRGIDLSKYTELTTMSDYTTISNMNSSFTGTVYAEFTVTDWWYYYEPVHGDPYLYVMALSPYEEEYKLMLNPLQNAYSFGIGEKYTLFIGYYREPTIVYAIQHIGV